MKSITKSETFACSVIASLWTIAFSLFKNNFWAGLWILAIPVDFFSILFLVIVFIASILFWIKNGDNYSQLYIPFCINTLAIAIILCLPSHNRSKQHYIGSSASCNYKTGNCDCNLYAEYYNVYDQGAGGTGLNSEYLTDSVTFRKYLGTYNEGCEHIKVACKGDSIIVKKITSEFINMKWNDPRALERKSYSLTKLKKTRSFD